MAIGLDGTEKSVEKWKNEDILELLEVLNDKRADLYGVFVVMLLKAHLTSHSRMPGSI